MSLFSDLSTEVNTFFRETWKVTSARVVPGDASLQLGNHATTIEATVLYADLADSTKMVDKYIPAFSAEIYKSFLHCAAKIIRSNGGTITAYDGDRVMAVYIGDAKNTSAVRTSLQLNRARILILQPALDARYGASGFQFQHVVGIDTCELFVARTGVRGANDLVWVGPAANYAAKMAALSHDFPTRISDAIYGNMNVSVMNDINGSNIWEQAAWNGKTIYRTAGLWATDF